MRGRRDAPRAVDGFFLVRDFRLPLLIPLLVTIPYYAYTTHVLSLRWVRVAHAPRLTTRISPFQGDAMTLKFVLLLIALLFLLLASLHVALPVVPFDLGWGGMFFWLLAEVIPGPRPA